MARTRIWLLAAGASVALAGAARAAECLPSEFTARIDLARPPVSANTALDIDGVFALNRDYQRRFAAERAKAGTMERLGDNAVYPFEPRIGALTVTTPLIRVTVNEGDAARLGAGFCRPVRGVTVRLGWQTRLRWVASGVAGNKCVGTEVTRELRDFTRREDRALEQASGRIAADITALAKKLALEPRPNDATGRLNQPLQDLAGQRYAEMKAELTADYQAMAQRLGDKLRTICGGAARKLLRSQSEQDT